MPFHLIPVTTATSFPPLIRTLYAAQDDPPVGALKLFTPILGDGPTAREDSIQMTTGRMWFSHSCDPRSTWMSVVDDESRELVAAAKWSVVEPPTSSSWSSSSSKAASSGVVAPPIRSGNGKGNGNEAVDGPKSEAQQKPKPKAPFDPFWLPAGSEMRRYAQMVLAMTATLRTGREGKHLALQIMFTHPAYRRKGAGTMLMKWGTELADELGLESWVQATPLGKALYLHFGYEVVKELLLVPDVDEGEKSDEWRRLERRFGSITTLMHRKAKGVETVQG
ncbi:hypothetical protein MMC25_006138 [Agyrium rufum]|nr:hypothetical protein [Agyrium rufum]